MKKYLFINPEKINTVQFKDQYGLSLKLNGILSDDFENVYDYIFIKYKSLTTKSYHYIKGTLCHKESMQHISSDDGTYTRVDYGTNEVTVINQSEFDKIKRQTKINNFFDNDIVHER